ncbi:MAG: glycoside hydrolase family 26 protein [Bacteroidales bacterium]|nr:glycoside hydrolase family 26 protein [Bacteroidales bacterium]
MKKTPFLLAIAILSACGGVGTSSIEDTLRQAAESGTPLFGHQDDLMYGHTWNATKENDTDLTRSDVLSVAGSYPYILGLDLGGLEIDSPVNLDGNDFNIMREAAIKHHERGGIVTLSWHLRNPLTGGDSWDVSNAKVVESILPGGELHEKFIGWLDRISDYIASFKDGNGRQIPVIWRPWHEHTGGWFWWGAANCTADQYNDLWKMTYNHMVNEKKLEGLLWAVSPNSLPADFESWESRYPGDEYVDIVGLDCYCSTYVPQETALPMFAQDIKRCLGSLKAFADKHGKILALTETGYEALTHEKWWTEVLAPAIEEFPIAYLLVWRNTDEMPRGMTHFYTPWPGGPSESDFVKWVEGGKVRLLK